MFEGKDCVRVDMIVHIFERELVRVCEINLFKSCFAIRSLYGSFGRFFFGWVCLWKLIGFRK